MPSHKSTNRRQRTHQRRRVLVRCVLRTLRRRGLSHIDTAARRMAEADERGAK